MKKRLLCILPMPFILCLGIIIGSHITEGRMGQVLTEIRDENADRVEVLNDEIENLENRLQKAMDLLRLMGKASFYGTFEHGKPTANGEKFSKYAMTAAAVNLPFNSIWKIWRVDTGYNVEVRINDRLPAKWGRIIDLSWAAAIALDMEQKGLIDVIMIPKLNRGDSE